MDLPVTLRAWLPICMIYGRLGRGDGSAFIVGQIQRVRDLRIIVDYCAHLSMRSNQMQIFESK